jgi:hypothetical protein
MLRRRAPSDMPPCPTTASSNNWLHERRVIRGNGRMHEKVLNWHPHCDPRQILLAGSRPSAHTV